MVEANPKMTDTVIDALIAGIIAALSTGNVRYNRQNRYKCYRH